MTPIESGDYTYLLEGGDAQIYDYRGTEEILHIPSALDGHPVSAIEPFSFSGCSTVKTVVIPEGVTSIGANAFEECTALASVVFPQSLKSIEDSAFAGCSILEHIFFSEGLEVIESSAFENCTSLVNIELPDSVRYIGYMAFAGCKSLKSCNIPDWIEDMHDQVFAGCEELALTVTPGRYLEAFAMMQHVPYVLRESAEGRSLRPKGVTRDDRLRDALYELINRDDHCREMARSLPELPITMTEKRLGAWKCENGHWVANPGFLVRVASFCFPSKSYLDEHMQECLIRALFHPDLRPPFSLRYDMPLLRMVRVSELGKNLYASIKDQLKNATTLIAANEAGTSPGNETLLFGISDHTLHILEKYWYD